MSGISLQHKGRKEYFQSVIVSSTQDSAEDWCFFLYHESLTTVSGIKRVILIGVIHILHPMFIKGVDVGLIVDEITA